MSVPAGFGQKIRFGEFELDLLTRELTSFQRKVSLQEQPFQILTALLERPGQMVSREELTRRLWPTGTFVDFERSLNKAVNRLREALEDSAERPRFIETLPRRGYRFVGEIRGRGLQEERAAAVPAQVYPWPVDRTSVLDAGAPLTGRKKRIAAIGIALGVIVMAGLAALWGNLSLGTSTKPLQFTQITHDGTYKDSLLTDGARLYYRTSRGESLALAEVSAAGGEPVPVTVPFENVGLQDISPDGRELLLTKVENGLNSQPSYRLDLPAAGPVRIGDMVYHAAAWSPDEKEIAYAADNSVFLARRDGGQIRKLADVEGETDFPHWSPDGKRLRFTVYDSKKAESAIWEVARDGSGLRQMIFLSDSGHHECCGQWTSDGKYFLFLAEQNSISNLWAIPGKSSRWWSKAPAATQLTFGPSDVVSYVPGKGSNRVFLISGLKRSELMRYDLRAKHFVPHMGGIDAFAVEFSHDRRRVIYVNPVDGTLWRSQSDGKNAVRLTDPGMYVLKPRWSPDDSRIAFAGYRGNEMGRVFVVSAEGGAPHQFTDGPGSVGFVSWSPDGQKLLVGEWNTAKTQDENNRMIHCYFLDLQTGEKRPLQNSAGLYGAQWSPDGRHIFAKTQTDDLRLLDLGTGGWSDLAHGPAEWACWSHDSRYVYFGSVDRGAPVLRRVNVVSGQNEVVAGLSDLHRRKGSGDSNWLGLDPDDVPLAVRNVSTYDVYALGVRLP